MTEKDENAKPVWTSWMEKQVRMRSHEGHMSDRSVSKILDLPEFQGIDIDELKRKGEELGIYVSGLTSAQLLEFEQEQNREFYLKILGWALLVGLAVLVLIGLNSLMPPTSSSSGCEYGGSYDAERFVRCLERQVERNR